MAHRIDGRKLGRKQGPRLALFKNLTVYCKGILHPFSGSNSMKTLNAST